MMLIALEGIDGAGKTTLLPSLANRLSEMWPTFQVIEAGEFRSALGSLLRQHLHTLTSTEKVLWFAADRASVWADTRGNLSADSVVVWDRYVASAIAYRMADARRSSSISATELIEYVLSVNRIFPNPDLYIYLDLPVSMARQRKNLLAPGYDLGLVQQCYREAFRLVESPVREVNAAQSPIDVLEACIAAVQESGVLDND